METELTRRTLSRTTDEWVVDLKDWQQLHAALPPRLIQAVIEGFAGKTVSRRQRQTILSLLTAQEGTQEFHLDKTLTVYREYDRLVVRHRQARGAQGSSVEATPVALSEMRQQQLQFAGHRVVISPGTCLNGTLPFEEGRIWLAKTQIGDQLQLRLWQPGDRIRLPWSGYRKKLKRYFIDKKISRYHRQRTVVVVDGERVAAFLNAPGIVGGTLVDRDYLTSSTASSLVGIAIEGSLV